MDFRVSEIIQVAKGIKSFSFKPLPGSPLAGKSFEFTPGQYLSLIVDVDGDGLTAPRHYTVTSPPGADFLQCTVKQIKGGKLSTHIHQHLKVGDTVKLAAPFGVFTLDEDVQSAVLMSAGIGITPMLNFKRTLGSKFRLCVHVDSTPESLQETARTIVAASIHPAWNLFESRPTSVSLDRTVHSLANIGTFGNRCDLEYKPHDSDSQKQG